MHKDFLFFNYSFVKNSTFLFESFAKKGHTIDIIDEKTLRPFADNILKHGPEHTYKNVVLYLHENDTIPITNHLINNYFQDAFLIQHDTTDHEHVQIWSNRKPDLIMQRELTDQTVNMWPHTPIEPFHFVIDSLRDPEAEKDGRPIDIFFMANMTNIRRRPFNEHVLKLSEGNLKHLNWALNFEDWNPHGGLQSDAFKYSANRCKIGLHYFGNSYDAWRIWQLASCKAGIIMPKMRNKSVSEEHMPFTDYCVIQDDFQDLEDKIVYMLENERYKDYGERAYKDYNENHKPDVYFDKYYYPTIMEYASE